MRVEVRSPYAMKGVLSQQGLSLVELMIALLLSSLITLGILTMYLDSTKTSQVSRSLSRAQEAGRISLDLIARDVRMAGYAGCADPFQDRELKLPASLPDFFRESMRGARAGGDNWQSMVDNITVASLENSAVAGSDVLQVRRANGPFVALDSDMAGPDSTIVTNSDQAVTNFRIGENALIISCSGGAEAFVVGDPGSLADNEIKHQTLQDRYKEGDQVFHFNTTVYWVGNTGRTGPQGNPVFALYQNGLEVVTGVERLQVLYGVLDSDDSVRFLNGNEMSVDQWNEVNLVQIGVLVSDEQSVMDAADAKSYALPGMDIQPEGTAGADATYPADGRLRTTFTTTVKLRNRID